MKTILILSLLAPNLLLGQGIPDTGNSKLWEMRKKVQQRSVQRTGSYVEQMNQALQSGDAEGAETALKAAIAQGTMTQTQINEARGRIESMVSQQRQAMVAEVRAKQEAEAAAARAAEEDREMQAAASNRQAMREASTSTPTSGSGSSGAGKPQESELSRFRSRWSGKTANFTVVWDRGGSLMGSNELVLQDPGSGNKFKISYDYGIGEGIADANQRTLEGTMVSVRFNAEGTPSSVKNPATGRSLGINSNWKVTGYGW